MRAFLRENGLSIAWLGLFLLAALGQIAAGHREYNEDQLEHGQAEVGIVEYVRSAHFLEALMENWESEFLQIFLYIGLTAVLYQRGSAESKKPGEPEAVDRSPPAGGSPEAPWPVRRGGWMLKLYQCSLSLVFALLFVISFFLHAASGAREYNQDQLEHGKPERVTSLGYIGTSRFWFESFQNWQSEFLSVGLMVIFSIFLRQRGSPESKPVDAPHSETGEE